MNPTADTGISALAHACTQTSARIEDSAASSAGTSASAPRGRAHARRALRGDLGGPSASPRPPLGLAVAVLHLQRALGFRHLVRRGLLIRRRREVQPLVEGDGLGDGREGHAVALVARLQLGPLDGPAHELAAEAQHLELARHGHAEDAHGLQRRRPELVDDEAQELGGPGHHPKLPGLVRSGRDEEAQAHALHAQHLQEIVVELRLQLREERRQGGVLADAPQAEVAQDLATE
eukprot:CAMPEP_0175556852 /NCGR_PEP_ID=MMETSP0096-20121207/35077_1 /TAXON_ID=311494 /ORGANISM="Alexandrium monilatum, Strain CCMP3105" /LENGTH=233 /DNA_ID=CAMNT_0016859991 /DNA_START=73 /DNA_END=773 /DNA_ORIENTATION=+